MIKGKIRIKKTLETILEKVSEYEIYRYYLGHDFKLGVNTNSPFRRDSTPSFNIFVSRRGQVKHTDYGDDRYNGTAINFVMQLFSLNYQEAVEKIWEDFMEDNRPQFIVPPIKPQDRKKIQVVSKKYTSEELEYWDQYGIFQQELIDNKVYSVGKLYIDKIYIPNPNREMRFAYIYSPYGKIYTPYAKDKAYKFITNTPNDYISGWDKVGSGTVIITKSKKDEIVLRKCFPNVLSVQAENTKAIGEKDLHDLKTRFKRIIINFDSDEVGIENCKYYNQFGFEYVNVPKEYAPIKDFADLCKEYGLDKVKEVLYDKKIL